MNHGSLFTGIGGFDLAAQWMGWNNVFHCENNLFCQQVLKYHFPKTLMYADIKTTDFTIWRRKIDVLSGGFPCQPYSIAGGRKGIEDDRHLWPEMLRAVREIQPGWVVGENVHGIVNWSGGMVFEQVQADLENEGYHTQAYILPACAKDAPHRRDRVWFVAYNKNKNGRLPIGKKKKHSELGIYGSNGVATNTGSKGLQRSKINGSITGIGENGNEQLTGLLQPAWQEFPTQSPLCGGDDGLSRKLDGITFPKWRTESVKAYGNAIVPQVVYEIFKAIEEYEVLAG